MTVRMVKRGCFTPFDRTICRSCFVNTNSKPLILVTILIIALASTGCVSSGKNTSLSLAPAPPKRAVADFYTVKPERAKLAAAPSFSTLADNTGYIREGGKNDDNIIASNVPGITPLYTAMQNDITGHNQDTDYKIYVSPNKKSGDKCKIKYRFDRKEVLAYEWGRNRLGFDVGGVKLGGGGINSVKIRYRLRIHPEKTKKEKCRYPSHWQGLIGSGYNEIFLRDEDNIWHLLRNR